ncbi:hypothetical protein [Streptomyces sp. NPDC048565]|uniref:hypothetical protein n=1 Tax=Streptomyces sp. NPDC048565 TaxID=3155266 RepID=UPI003424956E
MSFSADPKQPWSDPVLASRVRQGRRRRRWGVAAAGSGLVVIAGGVWLMAGDVPGPGGHEPMAICAVDSGTLRADVDADGRLDEILDPDRDGTGSVVFRSGDDRTTVGVDTARGFWQKLRGMPRADMKTRGTFGDFDGDGYLDLALFYSQEDEGDSLRENMVAHEVHYGPLARDLSSDRTGTIRMPNSAFVSGVRATDADHDGRAELQVLQSTGDGVVVRRVGRQHDGGVSVSREESDSYGNGDWHGFKSGWLDFGTGEGACERAGSFIPGGEPGPSS